MARLQPVHELHVNKAANNPSVLVDPSGAGVHDQMSESGLRVTCRSREIQIGRLICWTLMTSLTSETEQRFLNRELSWLDFNERVLNLAEDVDTPLLERVKFLAIFATNLDEFYMVRVAGLKRQEAAGLRTRSADGLFPSEQLDAIARKIRPIVARHSADFCGEVMPALREVGVEVLRWKDLDDRQKKELDELFTDQIFPVLTPLALDPGHPFPYISNLSLNLAVIVRDPTDGSSHFARVKVPPLLDRFVALSDDGVFVPVEDVIAANLEQLFPGMEILEHHAFRVTRNADFELDDDVTEDLMQAIEEELNKRRFSPAVRLEIEEDMSHYVLNLLQRELEVGDQDVHALPGPLHLGGLWDLYKLDRPDLKDETFSPVTQPDLSSADEKGVDIFEVLKEKDILVQHPYQSFTSSVQRFIEQAADDPNVLAIKQTLYRTSGDSPIVNALIDAAEAGKQVVVLVELKARFDERANINWARALEKSGCHVVYGLVGLKTHSKLCLVVRQEGDHLCRYVHVGTGNYNPGTARIYEDLGLLTADQQLAADVSELFNFLTGYSLQKSYRSLIVAPHEMREQIISRIQLESERAKAGEPARVVMKLNSLVDEAIIDALYKASQTDVQVDLIVRGICSLRPGVEGLSENIRVRSILGRFLEHSRVMLFLNGGEEDVFIGSADLMHRNLDRRVEAFVKIKSEAVKVQLKSILELALLDNSSSWTLGPDGTWTREHPWPDHTRLALQETLMQHAGADA